MASEFHIRLGKGSTASQVEASLENFILSLTPTIQKMTARQLQDFMKPHIIKGFKEVVRKWRAFLTRKGIDSKWDKPNGEDHIYNALANGPMSVKPAGRYRKIITWEILSSVDHLVFAMQGFGDVETDTLSRWGRQASIAAWANNKFGWKIPIRDGIVDMEAAKKVKMLFGGRETTAWGAIIALSRSVNDNRLRNYNLHDALNRYIETAIFSDAGMLGAFLKLSSSFDSI